MNELFQIPAEVSKVESMANRSLRLRVDSQESLTDEMMAKAMNKLGKNGKFLSGLIEVEGKKIPFIVFKNDYKKEDKQPDYVILKGKERDGGEKQEVQIEDIPF